MKTRIAFSLLIFSVCLATGDHLSAEELPLFGELPNPGKHWKMKNAGTIGKSHSWVNFDNAQSGDVLSFAVWKINKPGITVTYDPIKQASIEAFTSEGYAVRSVKGLGSPVAERIRHRVVSINIRNHAAKKNFKTDAIEYSYIYGNSGDLYENIGDASSTMAHGYVVVVGDLVLFVQHTSKHVITSDFASGMVSGLLGRHYKKASSIEKGWSGGISRKRVKSQ